MIKGFDANKDLSIYSICLLENGYKFVCRYYNTNNPSKNLTVAEANFLSSIGISIVAVWENGNPTASTYFSYAKGMVDGAAAYEYAINTIGQPGSTPIYFAVDYDATEVEVDGVITAYFKGLTDSFKQISNNHPKYSIGAYGSGLVCKNLKKDGLVTHTWLAQSTGWRESRMYKDYNIKQLAEKAECIDSGVVKGDVNESPDGKEGSFKVGHLTS